MDHISDDDLERYYLGMVKDEAELAPFEEHLLACRVVYSGRNTHRISWIGFGRR